MRLPVILKPIAQREFDEAVDWYEEQCPGLGVTFVEQVHAAFERIVRDPDLYPIVHRDIREAHVRQFPFRVLYRIEEETLIIHAIFHASRDPGVWQQRLP